MESLFSDLRFGVRALLRTPLATGSAVASLALGIAVTTTMFATVEALILRPLDAPEPDRILSVYSTNPGRGWTRAGMSMPDLLDLRQEARTLSLAGFRNWEANLSGEGEPELLSGLEVTANLFQVLGTGMETGRGFLPEEEAGARVAILGHGTWVTRYGADPGVVGSTVRLNGEVFTVVGVLPKDGVVPFNLAQIFIPANVAAGEARSYRSWSALARMSPGASAEQVRAELGRLTEGLERAYPEVDAGMRADFVPFRDTFFGREPRAGSMTLLVLGLMVLGVACANVVNLLLARAIRREGELAVRLAMGASRARIVRQLLTETAVLGLAGGALGTVLALAGLRGLVAMLPPIFSDIITLDGTVLLFATAIAVGSGILVGMAPALQASRSDLRARLVDGGRGSSQGSGKGRFRRVLVVGELAMALVLVVSCGLLLQNLASARKVELGFRTEGVLLFSLQLPKAEYPDAEAIVGFYRDLEDRLKGMPGVISAAASSIAPLAGGSSTSYALENESWPEGQAPGVQARQVTPGYFETLDMSLVEGRGIDPSDVAEAPPVLVVSEAFAELHWPDGEALGRRVEIHGKLREIVGVAPDARLFGPTTRVMPAVYMPAAQAPSRAMDMVLYLEGDPGSVAPAVRRVVRELDSDLAVFDLYTMEERLSYALLGEIVMPRVTAVMAGLALLLALVGVYGVTTHAVALRRRETGIRMALGAGPGRVMGELLGQGGRLLAYGAGIGLVLALLAGMGLSAVLVGVNAFDWRIFTLVPALLLFFGLLATYVPARRAARSDPVECFRME